MTIFTDKAPGIMALLMKDFDLGVLDAAAILGNLGHESGGFKFLQEIKPLVPGSRGGYGWAQWTGPRRRDYEAYCARNNLDPASDRANYGFLFVELTGSEKAAIPALKKATTLPGKVKAFEAKFERAGVKHYAERNKWAAKAYEAWQDAPKPVVPLFAEPADLVQPVPPPPDIEPPEIPERPPARPLWRLWPILLIAAALVAAFFMLT